MCFDPGAATAGRRYGCGPRPDAALIRLEALSAGAGTKGPRLHDWCYLELADLEAEQFNSANDGLWTRGLLIRRRIADDDLAFFTTWCPAGTAIETLVAVEGHRWAIEDSFETAEKRVRARSQREQILAWLAPSCVLGDARLRHDAAIRHRANPPPPKKRNGAPGKSQALTTPPLIRWSIQEIRRHCYQTCFESGFNPHISSRGLSGAELTRLRSTRPLQIKKATVMLRLRSQWRFKPSINLRRLGFA